MTDYLVPPNLSTTLTLQGSDTLQMVPVGSIVVDGAGEAAIAWDLDPGPSAPPGVVIEAYGLIQSLAGAGIVAVNSSGGDARAITITNVGRIASFDDAFQVGNALKDGVITLVNNGVMVTAGVGSGEAIDLGAVVEAAAISITNGLKASIAAGDSDAIRAGARATIDNSGAILGGSEGNDDSDGIDGAGNTGIAITNHATGSITGARHGVTGAEPITVTNEGTISGSLGSGIRLDTIAASSSAITNLGVIEGNSAGAQRGDGVHVGGNLDLVNGGTIRALGTSTDGPVDGVSAGGGSITNSAGGTIFGERGIHVHVDDGDAIAPVTISNDGSIIGGGGEAIIVVGGHSNTIANRGTIVGDVRTDSGKDAFDLFTGSSILGQIDGGAGDDEINLDGAGGGSLSDVVNVETLNVVGGVWSLRDSQSYASGVSIAKAATLEVGFGENEGSLAAAVLTHGVLAINRSDDYTVEATISGTGHLAQIGTGTTTLDAANSYKGGTTLAGGALRLSALGAAGTGVIGFEDAGQTLIIDDAALDHGAFGNVVLAMGIGDVVDFSGLAFAAGAKVDYDAATTVATVTSDGVSYTLKLAVPSGHDFTAENDGNGGTRVVLKNTGESIRGTARNDTITPTKAPLGQTTPTSADDSVAGRGGDDRIDGAAGHDALFGGAGNDVLAGGVGDDWLHGGTGSNQLLGGAGFDAYVFDTRLGAGKAGKGTGDAFSFARIKDFAIGKDQILLDGKIFKALDVGALSPDAFAIGRKAKGDDVHILYKHGDIRYDADGKGGAEAVLFAKVDKGLAIEAGDFLVI